MRSPLTQDKTEFLSSSVREHTRVQAKIYYWGLTILGRIYGQNQMET